jgi:two-component system OmpR family response regulator
MTGGKDAMRNERVRVLVVDDEAAICKAVVTYLQRAGYDVISTQSGDTAISYLQREHVDVLLVDLRIPDTRGDVVFESGAAHQPQLRHQTVFMTGDLSERGMDLVSWCKCPLLRKPFELSAMLAMVNSVAPRRGSGARSA